MAGLQKEVASLKEHLERMKREHEKSLLDLMAEIDDEKKTRFNMQVRGWWKGQGGGGGSGGWWRVRGVVEGSGGGGRVRGR